LGLLSGDLPEVVDLLALALSAGLNVSLAVAGVGSRASGELADELAQVAAETARGRRLADALDDLPGRCGEAVRPLCTLMAAGERYGVPLIESLERLAVDVRASERRRAEEAARRLPVKMLFPLVVCILPAFGLLTLGPMLVTSFPSLTF
jgi:tight adherence protein C